MAKRRPRFTKLSTRQVVLLAVLAVVAYLVTKTFVETINKDLSPQDDYYVPNVSY